MSEGPRQPDDPATPPVAAEPASTRAPRHMVLWRWVRRGILVAVAVLAAFLVSFFTVDLGPWFKGQAERGASNYLDRPTHIGRLSAMVRPGTFVVEDLVIEGRSPSDRPFFKAKRIYVRVPWWTAITRKLFIEIEVNDFDMVVESWAGGRTNIPRLTRPRSANSQPSTIKYTTTTYARRGTFTYDDHVTPWSVVARPINFELVRAENLKRYVGKASFDQGTVQIQNYKPMRTSMNTRFVLDGSLVQLQHLDLVTDGSQSHVTGTVDFSNWPRQTYNVSSAVDFTKMKDIFFAKETWQLSGEGQFEGQFKLFKEGGRDLSGEFSSKTARINALAFQNLHGTLVWTQDRFAVTHAEAGIFGGRTRFNYGLAPFGAPGGATAEFSAEYIDLDLRDVSRAMDRPGLSLTGRGSGSLDLEWANGHFSETRHGDGHTFVTPEAGFALAPRALPAVPLAAALEPQPFDGSRPLQFGADLHYSIDRDGVTFDQSVAATPLTYVSFSGRMATAGESHFPFHVTSHDWQESDWLLASIMTAVSSKTGAIAVAGRGTFDGEMTGTFSAPTISGRFTSEGTHVWDVTWGRAHADVVIHGGYVDITNSRIGDDPEAFIETNGRYALGFRKDDAEEVKAHVELVNWPVADLRHAFRLDDWAMDGTAAQVSLDLTGRYSNMFGSGRMRIEKGRAWGERFEFATADLALEGTGMNITNIEMCKGDGVSTCVGLKPDRATGDGVVQAEAHVGWDKTYRFRAHGEHVAVEHLDNFRLASAPLSGRLAFDATGEGEFESPSYEFTGSIPDLYIGDEGIGPLSGRLRVSGNVLTLSDVRVDSPRLDLRGAGTIAFDEVYTSNLTLDFNRTVIDPYLKFVMTGDVSSYPRTLMAGHLTVTGPLKKPEAMAVDATITDATLTVFDYELKNDGDVRLSLSGGAMRIGALKLRGADTNLELTGSADTNARTLNLQAQGSASLSMLTLLRDFQTVTASGAARLNASMTGSFDRPDLSGSAMIADGRLRPFDSPHGIEAINGNINFRSDAITLSNFTGRIGNGGDVEFGGSVTVVDGYKLSAVNLTATGRSMRLRYPEGFISTADMDLALTGTMQSLRLGGTITVQRMVYLGRADPGSSLVGLSTGAVGALAPVTSVPAALAENGAPLVLNIEVVTAPRMRMIDTKTLTLDATANLRVLGTFSRPALTGNIQIDGGQAQIFGNHYYIREGLIDFIDPDRLDPVFDIAAQTRPRVAGQSFDINIRVTGTAGHITPTITSDPWLPETDIYTLLVGGTADFQTAEQRSLRSSQELQQKMIAQVTAALFTSQITSRVGQVLARTGAVDTVQITPLLTSETTIQATSATARVTLGRRISNRVFLTYSRTLSGPQEEIIVLEYDQNDRLSWVLSRNEDRSFALDFRVRYVF